MHKAKGENGAGNKGKKKRVGEELRLPPGHKMRRNEKRKRSKQYILV